MTETYDFGFGQITPFLPVLLAGFGRTLLLTAESTVVATVVVATFFLLRLVVRGFGRLLLEWFTQLYIDVLQALPVLVGLVWIYFGAPLYGLRLSADNCVAIVLGLSFSAFALDLLRAAERAIPDGELFAASLHGVSRRDTVVRIVAPQIIRIVADPMVGQIVSVLKLSTFASIIGSGEILSVANGIIAQTYRPMEVFTIVAFIFVLTVVPLNIVRRARGARIPAGDRLG